jgi:hypothetical protein
MTNSGNDRFPESFLIVRIVCLAAAGLEIWIKYDGWKENKPHKITTSNKMLKAVSDIFELLVGY